MLGYCWIGKMIIKKTIFSIPIYFCSYSDFLIKIDKKRLKAESNHKKGIAYKKYGIEYEHCYKKNEWKFDKIIGWIVLYLNGKTIKADYWLINAKRIGLNSRNKKFEYKHKIADVSITHNKNNEQIIDDIKSFFSNCQQGTYIKKLKSYHIDTSEFFQFAKFINIKALIRQINNAE